MKKLLIVAFLAFAVWKGYGHYAMQAVSKDEPSEPITERQDAQPLPASNRFACDGRIYCSQMTSCAEATFFLQNCPGTKMDGDRDGVPCEQQWCGRG